MRVGRARASGGSIAPASSGMGLPNIPVMSPSRSVMPISGRTFGRPNGATRLARVRIRGGHQGAGHRADVINDLVAQHNDDRAVHG